MPILYPMVRGNGTILLPTVSRVRPNMTTNTKHGVPPIRFRPLRYADIDQLMELYGHAPWAVDRRRRDVVRMLAATPFTLSAWAGKRMVGFCRVLTDFVYRAVLYDVIVSPDLQGR